MPPFVGVVVTTRGAHPSSAGRPSQAQPLSAPLRDTGKGSDDLAQSRRDFLTLLACILLSSCLGRFSSYAEYSVQNNTDQDINNVSAQIGDHHKFQLGIVIPKTGKSYGGGAFS